MASFLGVLSDGCVTKGATRSKDYRRNFFRTDFVLGHFGLARLRMGEFQKSQVLPISAETGRLEGVEWRWQNPVAAEVTRLKSNENRASSRRLLRVLNPNAEVERGIPF